MNKQQIETKLFRNIRDFVFVTEINELLEIHALHGSNADVFGEHIDTLIQDHLGLSWGEFSAWSMEACGGESWRRLDGMVREFKAKCDAVPKLI
jgi:hypothetical protein